MTKRSTKELKAIAYSLADEIETRAMPLIAAGMSRENALRLTIAKVSGKIFIVKG